MKISPIFIHLRKAAAILLMLLLFFNWFGYRLVVHYLESRADLKLEAQLDANYFEESELITIKLPLQLSYPTGWQEFERHDGEIEIDGTVYKFVKRKISYDSLILLCIPHKDKMKLKSSENHFNQFAFDFNTTGTRHGQGKALAKNLLQEFTGWEKDFEFCLNVSSYCLQTAHEPGDCHPGFPSSLIEPPCT